MPKEENLFKNIHSKSNNHFMLWFIIFSVLCCVISLFSLTYGSFDTGIPDVLSALFEYNDENILHKIILNGRIPRVISAMLVGAALGVSGAIMQALTNNPLASPSTLGVTSGSMLLLVIMTVFFSSLGSVWLTLFAIIGSGLSSIAIFAMARILQKNITPAILALIGIALSTIISSLATYIGYATGSSQDVASWLASGISKVTLDQMLVASPFIILGLFLAVINAKSFTLISLGEETAIALGKNISYIRNTGILITVILVGAAIPLAGSLMFVGIIIPHTSKIIVGSDYRKIIPFSVVFGAFFILLCDFLARVINYPYEFPLGTIVTFIGAPFFIWVVQKGNKL